MKKSVSEEDRKAVEEATRMRLTGKNSVQTEEQEPEPEGNEQEKEGNEQEQAQEGEEQPQEGNGGIDQEGEGERE